MNPELPIEIQRQIQAAEGWLGLGSIASAMEELDEMPAAMRAHPKVLLARLNIYSETKKWDARLDIAETIVRIAPGVKSAWIQRSFALHELKRTQDAYDFLMPALERFKSAWLIPYNLACYCCQLGRMDEAEKWLTKAFTLGGNEAKMSAIEDEDLEPLWKSRRGSSWKAM